MKMAYADVKCPSLRTENNTNLSKVTFPTKNIAVITKQVITVIICHYRHYAIGDGNDSDGNDISTYINLGYSKER